MPENWVSGFLPGSLRVLIITSVKLSLSLLRWASISYASSLIVMFL